jgi:type II protein arginine methyltransferase
MQHAHTSAPWWQVFVDAIDKLPMAERPDRLAKLAMLLTGRGVRGPAADLAYRAWRQEREARDAESDTVRKALRAVTPGYHVQISTDMRRIAAWQAAFADVVEPGMLALEIGTGSGILAMLAAQAGAQVVSCESDPILAAIAEAVVRRNGLGERVHIVAKDCADITVPHDMPQRPEMLFLDLFSDRLFNYDPFGKIRSVIPLLQPDAVVIPARVALKAALFEFERWHRLVPGTVAGFDLTPLRGLSPRLINLDAADPDLVSRSAAASMIEAVLPHDMPEGSGESERMLVSNGGRVNGIVFWLRLELTPGRVLEARPEPTARGFYAQPRFFALPKPVDSFPGQQCVVRIAWQDRRFTVDSADWRS